MLKFKSQYADSQVVIPGARLTVNVDTIKDPSVQKMLPQILKAHPQLAHNFEEGDPLEALEPYVHPTVDVAGKLPETSAEGPLVTGDELLSESNEDAASKSTKQQKQKGK